MRKVYSFCDNQGRAATFGSWQGDLEINIEMDDRISFKKEEETENPFLPLSFCAFFPPKKYLAISISHKSRPPPIKSCSPNELLQMILEKPRRNLESAIHKQ